MNPVCIVPIFMDVRKVKANTYVRHHRRYQEEESTQFYLTRGSNCFRISK